MSIPKAAMLKANELFTKFLDELAQAEGRGKVEPTEDWFDKCSDACLSGWFPDGVFGYLNRDDSDEMQRKIEDACHQACRQAERRASWKSKGR